MRFQVHTLEKLRNYQKESIRALNKYWMTELEKLDYVKDPLTKHLSLWLHYWEGITFSSPQIPSLLGFKGVRDGTGYHIGYKQGSSKHSIFTSQDLVVDYPVDVCAGTQLMFIYREIIH